MGVTLQRREIRPICLRRAGRLTYAMWNNQRDLFGDPRWYLTSGGFAPIKGIIHPERGAPGKAGPLDSPTEEVMSPVVRVGIRADSHADPAIRACGIPVTETGIGVELPTPGTVHFDPIIK